MTIIASIQRTDAIFTVSDIMVSAPSKHVKMKLELPLGRQDLFKLKTSLETGLKEYLPAEASQKCVFVGDNSLVLWAGSKLIASIIIKEVAKAHQYGQHESLDYLIKRTGLSPPKLVRYHLFFSETRAIRSYKIH